MTGMICYSTVASTFPCCSCYQYVGVERAGWTHGFGWSRCPACSARWMAASATAVVPPSPPKTVYGDPACSADVSQTVVTRH